MQQQQHHLAPNSIVDCTPEVKSNLLRTICGNFQKPRSAAPLVKTVGDAKLAGGARRSLKNDPFQFDHQSLVSLEVQQNHNWDHNFNADRIFDSG